MSLFNQLTHALFRFFNDTVLTDPVYNVEWKKSVLLLN
jgi:hypothetical protein